MGKEIGLQFPYGQQLLGKDKTISATVNFLANILVAAGRWLVELKNWICDR